MEKKTPLPVSKPRFDPSKLLPQVTMSQAKLIPYFFKKENLKITQSFLTDKLLNPRDAKKNFDDATKIVRSLTLSNSEGKNLKSYLMEYLKFINL